MLKRTICVVTGSRAEYGLLRWLLEELRVMPGVRLQLVITGMHLEPRFGDTWREIEADGFAIDARVPMDLAGDSPAGAAAAMGRVTKGIGQALAQLAPDLMVVLGDRFEILAAVQAAMLARLPVAHLHGGELTEGAMDDAFRHAITKMSHLHFTAADAYARRVIQMGEAPARVFVSGALALEAVTRTAFLSREELARDLGRSLGDGTDGPLLLVTYHPTTLAEDTSAAGVAAMLTALTEIPNARFVFTGVNADPGHAAVDGLIADFVTARPERASLHASLGQRRYLSLLRIADAVVGNSSSGLYEAPALGVPTVNIGPRQAGRLRGPSVIDCTETAEAIGAALKQALDPAFRVGIKTGNVPHGGGAAARIAELLSSVPLDGLVHKRFHDLPAAA